MQLPPSLSHFYSPNFYKPMNPFITLDEVSSSLSSIFLLCCSPPLHVPSEHYAGSFLLAVDDSTSRLTNLVCALEFPEERPLVLYDTGDLFSAAKAYWALRAAGFADVKVLPCSAYSATALPIVQGAPPPVPRADRPYLPFNNELAMTKEEFLKRESFYQQAVQINYLAFNILDSSGKIQSPEAVLGFLQTSGIKFSQSRASIVHGKRACLGGLMMSYVSKRSVSVVIDEIESLGIPVVRDSRTRDVKMNNSDEGDEVKYNTVMAGYSVSIDDITKRPAKRTVNTRESGTCKNCVIS
jgi:hypothetical protein